MNSTKLKIHIEKLNEISNQRKGWFFLSFFVSISIIGIIFGWNFIHENQFFWILTCLGLLISMIWWYWTIKVLRHLLEHKKMESEILGEIIEEIRKIKDEVKKPPYVKLD
jgi:ABC-type bacteriocin/lantibiotic exporter with double-glycine peptidase domain